MDQQYVTKDMLQTFGITADDAKIASLLEHINATVEEQIGAEITESLSDEQLKQLLELQETKTDDEVGEWIASQVPNFAEIVDDNIAIVIGEVVKNTEGINQA